MTAAQTEKFLSAVEAAEITMYAFDVDDGTKFIHDGERHLLKYNSGDELLVNISSIPGGSHSGYGKGILIQTADPTDCHKARLSCHYEQAKTFLESLGTDITEDDLKVILDIDKKNYDLKPETGDYVSGFHYLSKKQYEELTPEEKAQYDASKAAYEKAKAEYIGKNQAASITL